MDLAIEPPADATSFTISRLALDLETLLGHHVDLLSYRALNPRLRETVLREQIVLF